MNHYLASKILDYHQKEIKPYVLNRFYWYYKDGDCYVNKLAYPLIYDIDTINKIEYIEEYNCSYYDMTDYEEHCLNCTSRVCNCKDGGKKKLTVDEYHREYCSFNQKIGKWFYNYNNDNIISGYEVKF